MEKITDEIMKKLCILNIEKPELYETILDMIKESKIIIEYAENHMNKDEIKKSSECVKKFIKEFTKFNQPQMIWIAEVIRLNVHLHCLNKDMDTDWRKQLEV